MKLRLPSKLQALLLSTFVFFTVSTGSSLAADGFSINFYSTSSGAGANASLSGAATAGAVPVAGDNWTNVNTTNATQVQKDNAGNALSGVTVQTSKGTWGPGGTAPTTQNGNLLASYIDISQTATYTVKIAGSPYLVSTVYLIMAGDGASGGTDYNSKFTAMSVNGTSYTGSGTSTVEGTGIWGDRSKGQTELLEGKNYLVVDGVIGDIVIGNVLDAGGRGTLAGVQVENAYDGTKRDLILTANGAWTGAAPLVSWSELNGSTSWVNSTSGAGVYASIVSTVAGGGTLTIGEGAADAVTTDAVVLASGSTSDLTISGGVLNLTGPSILRVDESTRKLTISSTISSTGSVTVDGAGTVAFGSNQSILGLSGAGKLDIDGTTLTLGSSNNAVFNGVLSSTAGGSLIKTGTGSQSFINLSQFLGTNITIQGGELVLGNASNRFSSFNRNVVAGADTTLSLWMGTSPEIGGAGPIILGDQFAGSLVIQSGVFALNDNTTAKTANIGTGKLHLTAGSTFLIRNGVNTANDNTFSNDIFLGAGKITLRSYGSAVTVISSDITGKGVIDLNSALTRTDGGTISFNGDINYSGVFDLQGGTTNFSGTVNLGALRMGTATNNLENGANMTIGSLRLSEGSGTNSTLVVKDGSTLTITGTNNNHETGASFLLNHWVGTSRFNVTGGTVHAAQLAMKTGWTGSSITMVTGGTLNIGGIDFLTQANSLKGKVFLGTNGDGTASDETATGRINMGSLGIANLKDTGSEAQLVLGRGTLGALANWATNTAPNGKTITLLSALGTIFDTQDIADSTKGYQITINHDLTGAGKIVKNGLGTLILNGTASNFTGGVELNKGTLSVVTAAMGNAGFRKLHISGTGAGDATPVLLVRDVSLTLDALTMADGARLNLGGLDTANTLSVNSSVTLANASFIFSQGDLINVTGDMTATGAINFEMSLAGYLAGTEIVLGSVTGSISNLYVVNTVVSSDYRTATATVIKKADNSVVATVSGGAADLTWTSANTVWDLKGDANWQGGGDQKFWQGDNVTFSDLGVAANTVQISGSVLPGKMILNNATTNYLFEGGSIIATGGFTKTGSGLWVLGNGSSLTVQTGFAMEKNTLGFDGGTLDISSVSTVNPIDLGILQEVGVGSTLDFGAGKLILGVKDSGSLANLNLIGTGALMAAGSAALDIFGVTFDLYAGTAGLNITGNTPASASSLGIFSGSWSPQTTPSGAIRIGAATGDTILDFGLTAVKNKGGIFGAAANIGDSTGITDTSVIDTLMSNISLVGTLSGTGDAMTSNTKITGKVYGGGIEGTSIYGSTSLSLNGIHLIGGSSEAVDLGNAVLIAGAGANSSIYGNASLNVNSSLVDSFVFGLAGTVTGDLTLSFTDSIFKKNVYAGGYGGGSLIKGDITLTAENTTFNGSLYGGRDGVVEGKITLSLKNSTVKGSLYGGYMVAGENKTKGGVDIVLDGTTVNGRVGIGGGGKSKTEFCIIHGDSSLTIKGNSNIANVYGAGAQYSAIKGNLLLDIQGGIIGEGKGGMDGDALHVAGQDGKIEGDATLKVSNSAHIKNEYISFAGFGGTGITGNAILEVTGGTVESNIMGGGSWGNKIGGNFNMLLSGGTFGKDGAKRGITGGVVGGVRDPNGNLVEGNVNITLDGGTSGLGATFLGGDTGSNYYIYAGSVINNVKGNTLVTLSNVSQKALDGIAGVANFKGVISGANDSGGGVSGAERKLVFDNYTTEVNAQFKHFTIAEVMNASNVTLKGTSTSIGGWTVKEASTLNIDDLAKLGGASSLLIDDAQSTVNLALAADASLSTNLLSGSGTFALSGSHILTLSADNSGFNGVMRISGGTLKIADNGVAGSATAEININGGTLDITGTANKALAQKLTGNGVLALNMDTAEAQASLTNTSSTFGGTMTLTKGILDVAAGSSLSGVNASLAADASLKLHDADLSRFAGISGAGNLLIEDTAAHTGDVLANLTGKLSIAASKTFTLTKTSAASAATLNAGVTINLGNESNLVLVNGSGSLWDQTIKDISSQTGSSNITLSGASGVTLRITGTEWKNSNSLNFTLNDSTLYKVFVDTQYAQNMLSNVTLTDADGVNNVLVGDDGLLTAFTNYLELPVESGSSYTSNGYYIVSGLYGVNGATTVDSSITAIEIRGLKISSLAADQPGKNKNTSFDLGNATLTLGGGTLLFDGDADYAISGGTIIGSPTDGLSVNVATQQLTISSVVGAAGSSLNKEGVGRLNLSNTLNASTINLNVGTLALSGTSTADGAAATLKKGASLILGNAAAAAYQSGMDSITNAGTVTLLEGASLKGTATFANNGTLNYNVGEGKAMDQVSLTGTGTVAIKSGSLNVAQTALSATQSYEVDAGASLSFDSGNGAAFAAALSGMGNVSYKGGSIEPMQTNVSGFGGKFTLTASDNEYRLQFGGNNAFKAGTTIVVENNAQFWDGTEVATARDYKFILTGNGHETRGALRVANGAVYNGTISIVGASAGIGGASGDSVTINSLISSEANGILNLGATGTTNGLGTVTLNGDNVDLAGMTLYSVNKVIANKVHALGSKLTLSSSNAGTQALEFGANVELDSITGFIASKTLLMAEATSGLTLKGSGASDLAGTISGKGGLILKGTGVVTLSGINSYEGGTTIQGSNVILSTNASALGTSAVTLDSGSLNAGGLAVTNAITAKTAASMSGMGAYDGVLNVSSSNPAVAGNNLLVTGDLRAKSLNIADGSARIQATGNVNIVNGGSFVLNMNNAYDAVTNPGAIIQSGGTVTIGGVFSLTFDTNLKGGVNEFKLFSGASFAAGNTATADILYNDEYLKAFFKLDSSAFASTGSIFITRNTPEGFFVNQADVDAMTDGYHARTDTALGAKATGTAADPVEFNKEYHVVDNSYHFMNGEGWLNVQTSLAGANNKVIVYDYIPENGAAPVTDDRGVIFSNNSNSFGGGMMVNNAHIVVDGSLAADASSRPIAGGQVNILGTGAVALGGNKAVLELRPLGAGNTDSFTIGNAISLRDGASIWQTGGQNNLTGLISIVSGSATLSNKTAQEMILSGTLDASANTTLNMDGKIVLDAENTAGRGMFKGYNVSLATASEFIIRNGAKADIYALSAANGTVTAGAGSSLNLTGASHQIGILLGNGTVSLNNGSLELGAGNTLDSTIGGNGTLKLTAGSTLVMGADGRVDKGVMVDLGADNVLDLAGHSTHVGGVTGTGTIGFNAGTLVITGASSEFKGSFDGAGTLDQQSGNILTLTGAGSSDVNLKATSGEILLKSASDTEGMSYGDLSATGGTFTVSSNSVIKSLAIGNGGTLTLGSTSENNQKAPIVLAVTGNASFSNGATINCIIPSGSPQLSVTGTIQLPNSLNVNLVDNLSGTVGASPATFILMQANGGFIDENSSVLADGTRFDNWNLRMKGSMALFYAAGGAYIDGNQVKAEAVRNVSNLLDGVAMSDTARVGSQLLWNAGMQEEGTNLRNLLDSVMNDVDAGNRDSASHSMAAAAGSTITSLISSQKEGFRQQQIAIRNRTSQMGVNQGQIHEDMPYFNMWMQGNGGYNKLDTKGDESGYTLSTWGGTVGFDVDLNEKLTLGAAFTANYGKLKARAADTADGDNDAYYVNLFARAQFKKWSHTFIVTGGWNDASLNRTVAFNGGSYTGHGNTNGAGYGAMYEAAYDIALNTKKTSILQPLFNASIVSTKMDGYDESGAGNAGLHVDKMDMTTGTLAAGARWMGLVGSNLFGREALGEARLNIAQDVGDKKGAASVGFLGNPGFMQTVKGSKIGTTGIQAGFGLSVPVNLQGTIYVDANTDFRSGATTVGGTIGYRYNF